MLIIHNWYEKSQELHIQIADLDKVTTAYLQSIGEVIPDFISEGFIVASSVCL